MTLHHSSALILLSTYNGEKYLAEQLNSIISQTFYNWILLIRDDGSTDSTVDLIKKYCKTDQRIILLKDNLGNLKVQKSFSTLMQAALMRSEEFIFFCDQDDVWLPEKLARQIMVLKNLQHKYGNDTPLLVHTDLSVVNKDLNIIHPSFLVHEKLKRNPEFPLKTLLINNYVTGCTIGMNRALLNIATPVADNAFIHDWWCALCAAATGKIEFIHEPLILYRQHGNNSIGSNGFYGKFIELKSFKYSVDKRKKNLNVCFKQAAELLVRVSENNRYVGLIKNFAGLIGVDRWRRYKSAARLGLEPAGKIRTVIFWVFLGLI